jgi:hypothetical protein
MVAAPRQHKAAHPTASLMEAASGAGMRAAPSPRLATQATAAPMGGVEGVSMLRAAPI